eukprot:2379329-Amphidinium_carterae.1
MKDSFYRASTFVPSAVLLINKALEVLAVTERKAKQKEFVKPIFITKSLFGVGARGVVWNRGVVEQWHALILRIWPWRGDA